MVEQRVGGLHHVQLAMPAGEEAQARQFYGVLLGLTEIAKPARLAARGGVWFQCGSLQLHLGVDADFAPAKKAHPGLLVGNLAGLIDALTAGGHESTTSHVPDPSYMTCGRLTCGAPRGAINHWDRSVQVSKR